MTLDVHAKPRWATNTRAPRAHGTEGVPGVPAELQPFPVPQDKIADVTTIASRAVVEAMRAAKAVRYESRPSSRSLHPGGEGPREIPSAFSAVCAPSRRRRRDEIMAGREANRSLRGPPPRNEEKRHEADDQDGREDGQQRRPARPILRSYLRKGAQAQTPPRPLPRALETLGHDAAKRTSAAKMTKIAADVRSARAGMRLSLSTVLT